MDGQRQSADADQHSAQPADQYGKLRALQHLSATDRRCDGLCFAERTPAARIFVYRYRTGLPVQRFDADVRRYRKLSGRQRFQPGRMRFVHSVGGRYGFLSDDLSYRGGYGLEQVENGGKLSIRRRHRQRDLFLRQTRRSLFYRKNEQRLLCRLRREAQFRNAEKGVVGTGQFGRI